MKNLCKGTLRLKKNKDMKLERAIQRASKVPGGIIREQRKETCVAEWNLVFHEIYLIDDLFHNLS